MQNTSAEKESGRGKEAARLPDGRPSGRNVPAGQSPGEGRPGDIGQPDGARGPDRPRESGHGRGLGSRRLGLELSVALPPPGLGPLLLDALHRSGAREVERVAGHRVRARWLIETGTRAGRAHGNDPRDEVMLVLRSSLPGVALAPTWKSFDPETWLAARGERELHIPGIPPIIVLPGVAFGDGDHPTTRRALAYLVEVVTPGARVADVGSGSGLLSVAAALLGAAEVVAVEMDPAGVDETGANARRNQVGEQVRPVLHQVTPDDPGPLAVWDAPRIPVHTRTGGAGPGGEPSPGNAGRRPPGWDGIVANLEGPVLLPLLPVLREALAPGGWLLLSGLHRGEAGGVATALGLEPEPVPWKASAVDDGWLTLLVTPG